MGLWTHRGLTSIFGMVLAMVACTPPNVAGDPLTTPTTDEAFGPGGVRCSAVRPQTEPDLMAWDSGSRLKLAGLRQEGVVAVRYQAKGCNVELEVLPCVAGSPKSYSFQAYSANDHKVAHNASELFAQLPVGAARLAGNVKGNRALRTDYMLAGQYRLPTGTAFKASDLRGPREVCDRATHVVSAIYVGAFAMAAGESRAIEASASLLGAGAGGKSMADVESLADEGSAEACKVSQAEAKENARCAVPLRIGLLALEGAAAPEHAPAPAVVAPVQPPAKVAQMQPVAPPRAGPSPPASTPVFVAPAAVASGSCPAGMASIPAGTFMMGSNDGDADEKPVHRVAMGSFCMDVTTDAYAACVTARGCTAADIGVPCNTGQAGRGNHPINCVDWNQATAYCAWTSKRLPTEEEWEYGARGTEGREYPWGNEAPGAQLCWNGNGSDLGKGNRKGTCVVGRYPAGKSPFGLMDMAGNVREWTASGYSNDYSKTRANAARVSRGGRWDNVDPDNFRGAVRYKYTPTTRIDDLGFRCVR